MRTTEISDHGELLMGRIWDNIKIMHDLDGARLLQPDELDVRGCNLQKEFDASLQDNPLLSVDDWLRGRDSDDTSALLGNLLVKQQKTAIERKLEEIKQGKLLCEKGFVSITAQVEGVQALSAFGGIALKEFDLPVGETLRGQLKALWTAPEMGGMLRVNTGFLRTILITDLANLTTGMPQVSLSVTDQR